MWPALLLLRIQRFWLPLPLFLLWPLVGLIWLVVLIVHVAARNERTHFAWFSLRLLGKLRGLQVDIQEQSNTQISIQLY